MKAGIIRYSIMTFTDLLLFYAALVLSAYAYLVFGANYPISLYACMWQFTLLYLACSITTTLWQGSRTHPNTSLAPVAELRSQFISISMTYLLLFAFLSLSHQTEVYSRVALCCSFFLNLLLLPVVRHVSRFFIDKLSCARSPILIAGATNEGRELAKSIKATPSLGMEFKGFLDDSGGDQVLGPISEAQAIAEKLHVDNLVVCLPAPQRDNVVRQTTRFFRHVLIVDPLFPVSLLNSRFCNLNGLIGLEMSNGLLEPVPRFLKSMFETVLALIALLLLWPLFILLSIAVKFSGKGPVFYVSERLGLNGKTIKVYKFRTMHSDADTRLEKILSESPAKTREWKEQFKLRNDPRITTVGRFLRKTSLDELPQLWNVLKGDMAIIGPRPIVQEEVSKYGPNYELLQKVRPGMTGLWQVSGRSKVSYERRVALDVHYIMNWSIWMDYYILLKTLPEIISGKGAY